ncbi:protocadherin alpha-11-like isoform X2 [Tachypleus tridentatus]|uniref:protocadherin alpha-11-like isoform X2 n=1 Tax=Tachypleus tridentatus TaxID=6853 RepID=UPI003FD3259F
MNKEDGEICEIRVNVKDINNKPPKFRLEERSFEVTENVENAPITNLTAYDFDSNNKLRYRINFTSSTAYMPNFRPVDVGKYNYEKLFNLNKETGELQVQGMLDRESVKRIEMFLTVEDENAEVGRPQTAQGDLTIIKKVDYEEHQWLNFTVTATDSGNPNHSSNTFVFLEVGDVNDNDPVFLNESYKVEILEEGMNYLLLLTVKATDKDSNTYGMYGLVNYRLQRGFNLEHRSSRS